MTIVVENEAFHAHRLVLAAGSDYMQALLCEDRFEDSTKEAIQLPEMKACHFRVVLEWIYERRCEVEKSMITDVLEMACRLQCVDLLRSLEKTIADDVLMPETCLEMWDFAERMQLPYLVAKAMNKAAACYEKLTDSMAFNALPAARLSTLLANKSLEADEEIIFISVLSWVKAQNEPPTEDELGEIFENIRFSLMSSQFIANDVEREEVLLGNRRGVLSLVGGLREKAHNVESLRTSSRCSLSMDHFKGFRFHINGDV